MKKIILIFTILLIISSCKMTKDVTKQDVTKQDVTEKDVTEKDVTKKDVTKKDELYRIDKFKSFDDAEAWFDSIHNIPIHIDDINIVQN